MVSGLAKVCIAGAALALVCWAANYWWLDAWQNLRFGPKLLALLITIAVGVATFFSIAFLLRVKEVRDVVDLVRRKLL